MAIGSKNPVDGLEGFARNQGCCSLDTPARPVVWVNLVVPANWIVEPLFLRKSKNLLKVRTDVGFAKTPVKVGHENDRGNLLNEYLISRLQARWRAFIARQCRILQGLSLEREIA
jgi:hypothetical protein